MNRFPTLKTGAAAQYPSRRERVRPTTVLRFLDGGEQRIPEAGRTTRRWAIPLRLLDEGEAEAFEQLFEAVQGQSGSFAFTDPNDGVEYPDCSFDHSEFTLWQRDEGRGEIVVYIRENRGTS